VHAVVADLQVGQAGAGFFAGFEVDQELPGVLAQRLQFVQFAVVAGFNTPPSRITAGGLSMMAFSSSAASSG
jgi:hypothetical protein